ncbi:MAG: hypothetical protein AAFY11_05045 [Cyanobacteria bacterium J06641_5]
MSRPIFRPSAWAVLFCISLVLSLAIYILRGQGALSYLPGGIVTLGLFTSTGLGVLWVLDKTR